jgi:2',3'-cyclic-nucleotide 2'-phosphodiesterase
LRILFIGDVVGAAGMTAVKSMLPDAISRWEVDLAVVNGENSAGTGFGITEDTYQGIRGAGADVVTLGNHSWNRKVPETVSLVKLPSWRRTARVSTSSAVRMTAIVFVPGDSGIAIGDFLRTRAYSAMGT